MDLEQLRKEINQIDDEIVTAFCRRMQIAGQIAEYKIEKGLPIYHPAREQQVLDRMAQKSGPYLADSAKVLFQTMMDVSKSLQYQKIYEKNGDGQIAQQIDCGDVVPPERLFDAASVACQGIPGAYAHLACRHLFCNPNTVFYTTWDEVFDAVEQGCCDFGIVPIENSSAGTVTQVYDLLTKYGLTIAREIRLPIHHCLLTKQPIDVSQITDLYSHEQALRQCSEFINQNPQIRIHVCNNTAVAAKLVSECEQAGAAAISAKECAELYNLSISSSDIQISDKNTTRFLCITKKNILTTDADKISICLALPHIPHALYRLTTRFAVNMLNLVKIESRPLPNTEFEFLFYLDFAGNVHDEKVRLLLEALESEYESFRFFGNYHAQD